MTFFVPGDEWGLIEVVPTANREFYRGVAERSAEHHKDTQFGPTGWTTPPFVLPEPAVPISERHILLGELEQSWAGVLLRADRVETCTDFCDPAFEAADAFAFAPGSGDGLYQPGLYGQLAGVVVSGLYWHPGFLEEATVTRLAAAFAALASRHSLMLVVCGQQQVNLADPTETAAYLFG